MRTRHVEADSIVLQHLGAAVRARRLELELSQHDLADRAGLSPRFVVQLEGGTGNISYARFRRLAHALELAPAELVQRADSTITRPIALVGLRGAGKSTVGRLLAARLGVPFAELDERVEEAAGISLGQIFELHGEAYYRRLEREVLAKLLDGMTGGVIATGGGIVTDPETYAILRRRTRTVWLRAEPEEHWSRVVAQGDFRPMTGRPEAMRELSELWAHRQVLYRQADEVVETDGRTAEEVAGGIAGAVAVKDA